MIHRHHRCHGSGGGGGDGVDEDGRSGEWPSALSVAAWPTATALGAPSHVLSSEYPEGGGPGAVEEGSAKKVISMGGGGGMSEKMGLQRRRQM